MNGKATLALLVGGKSRRMGEDKGLLSVRGKPLVIRQILRLQSLFQEILIIASSFQQKERYEKLLNILPDFLISVRVVLDEREHDHAAYYGLKAALKESQKVVVLPVDAVGIDQKIIEKLLKADTLPAAYINKEDHLYPFPSLWIKEHQPFFPKNVIGIGQLLRSFPTLSLLKATGVEEKLLNVNLNTPDDVKTYFGSSIKDSWGRHLNYLRLSLTQACNMACQYCLPRGFAGWENAKFQMPFPEVCKILEAFRKCGFEKVRFTGGEPSLHPKLLDAICEARGLGYETISLTTNGSFIQNCSSLIEAGLTHINISLDTVDENLFFKITGSKHFSKVMTLIDQALKFRMNVKINTVVLRTQNFQTIPDLLEWAKWRPLTLRFIELMPTGLGQAYFKENTVSNKEVQSLALSLGYAPSLKLDAYEPAGPAVLYDHADTVCRLGFISPLSCNFCSRCNRLRVTAQGKLRLCLFSQSDLILPMKESPQILADVVRSLLVQKQKSHYLTLGRLGNMAHFRAVGG